MKRIKLIVFTILILSILLGIVGCEKENDEISSDEFISSFENVVGLSEENFSVFEFDSGAYRVIHSELVDTISIQYLKE